MIPHYLVNSRKKVQILLIVLKYGSAIAAEVLSAIKSDVPASANLWKH